MQPGDRLPAWELPITPTLVVSTALATRDFQDVHHDRDRARAAGSQDIFLNILTTTGLCERYVTEWAGPEVQIRGVSIRLGAPAYPYDTLVFSGEVTEVADGVATIAVTGAVSLGAHVTGVVRVVSTGSTSGDEVSTGSTSGGDGVSTGSTSGTYGGGR